MLTILLPQLKLSARTAGAVAKQQGNQENAEYDHFHLLNLPSVSNEVRRCVNVGGVQAPSQHY